jgi:hypothetical protein
MAIAALVAASATPAWADNACLQFGYIRNWTALNDRTLIVEDDARKKFKLKLIGVCSDLDYHEQLAFKSRGSLSISCLSPGDQVITRGFGIGPERCAITSIQNYTPEMEQMDKAAAKAAKEERKGY